MIDQQIYNTDFPQFFIQAVKERGYNLKKLSEASGISLKHIESLACGNFEAMPSAPYFHGYLQKLGALLDFDAETWWTKLRAGNFVHDATHRDALVKSRRTRKSFGNLVWIGGLCAIVLLYLTFQFTRIFGRPVITLRYPTQNLAVVSEPNVNLAGTLENGTELYVNNESVALAAGGAWEKSVLLQQGLNTLEIRAKKFLGGEATTVTQIVYEPASPPATSTGASK